MEEVQPLILFDSDCLLCNKGVQFVIKYDKKAVFKFASLQSATGQQILKQNAMQNPVFDTFVLVEKNRVYTKSTAGLRVLRRLSGLWPVFYVFIVVPFFIRDWFYALVAKNRHKFFRKTQSCLIPTPELKNRTM